MTNTQPPRAAAITATFSWRDVPPAERDWLARRTQDIETFVYRSACDIIRIGQILAEVKKRLPHGQYQLWESAFTPFSASQSRRIRICAKVFNPFIGQIERIEPSALYVLAQDNTPRAAREHAVREATAGTKITHARAREILDAYKPIPEPTDKETDRVERLRTRLYREEDRDQARTEVLERQDDGRAERLGRLVAELVEGKALVELSKTEDGENEPIYSVTTYEPSSGPRNTCDRDLARAVQRAAGAVEYKFCAGCCVKGGEELAEGVYGPCRPALMPTSAFGRDRRTPDLLMVRCDFCERPRKREIRLRNKAEAESTPEDGGRVPQGPAPS